MKLLGRALLATTVFRWTLAIAAGFAAMAFLLFSFIYWQTAIHERQRIDALVTREARAIFNRRPDAAKAALEDWIAQDLHAVRYGGLFAADESHVTGNLLNLPNGLSYDGEAHRAVFVGIDRDHDGDDPEVVRAVALRLADHSLLVLGWDIDELEDVETIVLRALSLGILPALLLSLIGGTLLARRARSRIASVHEAVGRIMAGRLEERLPVRGSGDDLDRLATAVNGMLQEIERLFGEIRGVGDSIAHDLRTPLTRVRTRLERSLDESRTLEAFQVSTEKAITSVDQVLAVVSAVLRIGEIEHGRRRAAFAPVDMPDVLRDAIELYEPLAEDKAVELLLDAPAAPSVTGDRELLLEAVGNLLDNAIKYTPPGSSVRVSLTRAGSNLHLRITDEGPGIAEVDRERVLQRFFRTERSRQIEGSGLGLSLVAAIVTLHGFKILLTGADPGCVVNLICPIVSSTESTLPDNLAIRAL